MITIRLHGPLRGPVTEPIRVDAKTIVEAVEAIVRQLPHLKPDINFGIKRARVVGHETRESLFKYQEEDLTIDIVPAVLFSGSAGGQIVAGLALITVGILMGGVLWPTIIISMGVSMVMGGIMQLLAPQMKLSKEEEMKSRYLGSPPNTVGIGTRIPVLYGTDLIQGHIISSDVDAKKVA